VTQALGFGRRPAPGDWHTIGEIMRDQHIIEMLEEKSVSRLREDELAAIESHTAGCSDCLQAYQAARLAGSLIDVRAAAREETPPFFATRVMAAIRERRLSPESPAWLRLWRAAGSLLLAMATLMVILIGLTVFSNPMATLPAPEAITSQNSYSLDDVVLGQDDQSDDATAYDQVLGTIYGAEGGDGE
jgi:predicted anti-sigma-YlaC factor YlaD